MVTAEPRGVTGENINSEQAKKKVAEFFGQDKIKAISDVSKNDSGPIKTYGYKVTFKDRPDDQAASIDVTQKGGHIFWMLLNRASTSAKLNIDQAKEVGRTFLKNHGYANMVDTYYLKEDNTAVINFAYKQDGVVIYPDLIKLKIALDNGEVVGFESKGYLAAHTARKIPKPKMTEQQARALISKKMNILSSGTGNYTD
jgi:germination protein YpeB